MSRAPELISFTAFEYFRNDVLDANDWFSNANHLPKPEERQNDFGGLFGGPRSIQLALKLAF